MIEVGYSSSFNKAYKKLIKASPEIEEKFWERVDLFCKNPYDFQLKTHKLTGKLKDLWSFSLDYSLRIIFYFEDNKKATFIDIGSHKDIY